jgi:hypothetical protein
MGFSPGFSEGSAKAHDQSIEGDGLQAVRYHRKTIPALAAEGSFFSKPEAYNDKGTTPGTGALQSKSSFATVTPALLCDTVPKDSAS